LREPASLGNAVGANGRGHRRRPIDLCERFEEACDTAGDENNVPVGIVGNCSVPANETDGAKAVDPDGIDGRPATMGEDSLFSDPIDGQPLGANGNNPRPLAATLNLAEPPTWATDGANTEPVVSAGRSTV
jgi:hypothetical protein